MLPFAGILDFREFVLLSCSLIVRVEWKLTFQVKEGVQALISKAGSSDNVYRKHRRRKNFKPLAAADFVQNAMNGYY